MAKLCAFDCDVQITSSAQYGDEAAGGVSASLGVFGSRTCNFTVLALCAFGSTTGR